MSSMLDELLDKEKPEVVDKAKKRVGVMIKDIDIPQDKLFDLLLSEEGQGGELTFHTSHRRLTREEGEEFEHDSDVEWEEVEIETGVLTTTSGRVAEVDLDVAATKLANYAGLKVY